jgi:hypothetical protein
MMPEEFTTLRASERPHAEWRLTNSLHYNCLHHPCDCFIRDSAHNHPSRDRRLCVKFEEMLGAESQANPRVC